MDKNDLYKLMYSVDLKENRLGQLIEDISEKYNSS